MKTTILAFACGILALTGCATQQTGGDGGVASSPSGKHYKHGKKRRSADSTASPTPLDLFGAAARGDLRGVQDALARGASVDSRNPAGATALLLASTNGSLPVIQTLVAAGADVNAADNNGRTPLAAATAGGYDDIARALRAAGARGTGTAPTTGGGAQWWNAGGAPPAAPGDEAH